MRFKKADHASGQPFTCEGFLEGSRNTAMSNKVSQNGSWTKRYPRLVQSPNAVRRFGMHFAFNN